MNSFSSLLISKLPSFDLAVEDNIDQHILKLQDYLSEFMNIGIAIFNPNGKLLFPSTFEILSEIDIQNSKIIFNYGEDVLDDINVLFGKNRAEIVFIDPTLICGTEYRLGAFSIFIHAERYANVIIFKKYHDSEIDQLFRAEMQEMHFLFNFSAEQFFNSINLNERLKSATVEEQNARLMNTKLRNELDFDELTGIHSRSYLKQFLKQLDAQHIAPVCVVMGDVNNLKVTNDIFGHRHGDILLKTIAQVLQQEASDPSWVVARQGGDEFYVLMPHTLRRDAMWYCHRVSEKLLEISDCCMIPTVSLGISKKSDDMVSLEESLNIAEIEMYKKKNQYKDHLNLCDNIYQLMLRRGYIQESFVKNLEITSVAYAQYLGLEEITCEAFRNVAWTHELGKTIITSDYYYTPFEEMTKRQQTELKKYPYLSMKICMLELSTENAGSIVKEVKERWDGKGFPRSLKGSYISHTARKLRPLIDYVEFFIPERNSKTYTKEEVKNIIISRSGTYYDPTIIPKFIGFLDSYEGIFPQYDSNIPLQVDLRRMSKDEVFTTYGDMVRDSIKKN